MKDLPHGDVPLRVWVRKRQYTRAETAARGFRSPTSSQPLLAIATAQNCLPDGKGTRSPGGSSGR